MPRIQRKAKVLVLVLAISAASTGAWWYITPPLNVAPLSIGQIEPPAPLTEAQHTALWQLLTDIDLDRDALIALNVSSAQAVDLLSALRSWHDLHGSAVEVAQAGVGQALAAVRRVEAQVRLGEAEPAALEAARAALRSANQAYAAELAGLRTTLATELTESQRVTSVAIAHGWGRAMPMRMLALTSAQKQDYATALRRHRLAVASATSDAELTAAEAAWQQARAAILTPGNLQVINAWHEYAPTAADALANAEENVMPTQGQVG